MARGPQRSPAPPPEDADATARVRAALEALEPPVLVAPTVAEDADRLTDLLLDHGERFDGMRLLYFLTLLQGARLEARCLEHCVRENLFLDSRALAEEAIVTVYVGWLEGRREAPYKRWSASVVRETADAATTDPDFAQLDVAAASPAQRLVSSQLAQVVNQLSPAIRKIVWLAFVDGLSPAKIADAVGSPLERVEWLLATVIEEAQRGIRKALLDNGISGEEQADADMDQGTAGDGEEEAT